MKAELINRLDEIIPFAPLKEEHLLQIARLELEKLRLRLIEQGVSVSFAEDLPDAILRRGVDMQYGARAVRRVVEKEVGSALARRLLDGSLPQGVLTADLLEAELIRH